MERQEGVPKVVMVMRLTARGAAGFFAFVGICLKATTSIARPSIQLSSIGRIPPGRGLPAGFGYSAMQNDAVPDTFHQGSRTLAFIVCVEAALLRFLLVDTIPALTAFNAKHFRCWTGWNSGRGQVAEVDGPNGIELSANSATTWLLGTS